MKLSEYSNEKSIELLADILEPVTKILADEKVKEAFTADKRTPLSMAKPILKGHPHEVVEILAALDGVDVKDYKCNVFTLPTKVIEMLNDKELMSFFTSSAQMTEETASGCATESIGAEEQ